MSYVELPETESFSTATEEFGVTFITCTNGESVCRGRVGLDEKETREIDRVASEGATAADRAFENVTGPATCISVSHFPFWNGGFGQSRKEFGGGHLFAVVASREILERDEDGRVSDVGGWSWVDRAEVPAEFAAKIDAAIEAADRAFEAVIKDAAEAE